MGELLIGLTKYFASYTVERLCQALGKQTTEPVYESRTGSGVMFVGKYLSRQERQGSPFRFDVRLYETGGNLN